jgi:hypothetical protein
MSSHLARIFAVLCGLSILVSCNGAGTPSTDTNSGTSRDAAHQKPANGIETLTPSPSASPVPVPSESATPSPSPTATRMLTPPPTSRPTPTVSPSATVPPTPSPSASPTPSPSPTRTPTAAPTPTRLSTPTAPATSTAPSTTGPMPTPTRKTQPTTSPGSPTPPPGPLPTTTRNEVLVKPSGFNSTLFVQNGSASLQFSSNSGGGIGFLLLADGQYQSAPGPSSKSGAPNLSSAPAVSAPVLTLGWRFSRSDLQFSDFPVVAMSISQSAETPKVAEFELFQSGQLLPFYVQRVVGVPDPANAGEDTFTFNSGRLISWVSDSSSTYWLEIVRGPTQSEMPLDACPGQTVAHGNQSTSTNFVSGGSAWLCVPSFWTFGGGIRLPFVSQGSAQMTLTSGTTNIFNQPNLGPSRQLPIYYGNFTIASPVAFSTVDGSARGLDALTASGSPAGIVPGQYYTAYGRIVQNGASTPLVPCYEAAQSDKYGRGWLHGVGSLLFGVQVISSAAGVFEVYADGTTAPTGIRMCPFWLTPIAPPTPSPPPPTPSPATPSPAIRR